MSGRQTGADGSGGATPLARARWMSLLARSEPGRLESLWAQVPDPPAYRVTRPAEVGLVMVRGRAGGTGRRFNLGEATVSRCAVTTDAGYLGIGYVRGRNLRHAELAALFDALLQDPARLREASLAVIEPLRQERETARRLCAEEAEATRVEFFTLVRGEDA